MDRWNLQIAKWIARVITYRLNFFKHFVYSIFYSFYLFSWDFHFISAILRKLNFRLDVSSILKQLFCSNSRNNYLITSFSIIIKHILMSIHSIWKWIEWFLTLTLCLTVFLFVLTHCRILLANFEIVFILISFVIAGKIMIVF